MLLGVLFVVVQVLVGSPQSRKGHARPLGIHQLMTKDTRIAYCAVLLLILTAPTTEGGPG